MYHYQFWDKRSTINGVKAEDVIRSQKINTAGEVGLILNDRGRVVVFQYDNHTPYDKPRLEALLKKLTAEMNQPPQEAETAPQDDATSAPEA